MNKTSERKQEHRAVVDLARRMHREFWTTTANVGVQTKSAQQVCREWQRAVMEAFPGRFERECVVGSNCGEKIDLVDKHAGVAYELKVSPNNTHFEFYRDVFKVWIQRELGREPLKKLVFITPQKGTSKLNGSFGNEVLRLAEKHGLIVEVVAI